MWCLRTSICVSFVCWFASEAWLFIISSDSWTVFEGCWDAGGTNPPISCIDFAILHRNVCLHALCSAFLGAIFWTEHGFIMFSIMFHHFRTAPGAFGSLDSKLPKTCTLSTCEKLTCSLGSTLRELRKRLSFMNLWGLWVTKARRVKNQWLPETSLSAQGSEARHSPPFLMLPWPAGLVQKGSPMP